MSAYLPSHLLIQTIAGDESAYSVCLMEWANGGGLVGTMGWYARLVCWTVVNCTPFLIVQWKIDIVVAFQCHCIKLTAYALV